MQDGDSTSGLLRTAFRAIIPVLLGHATIGIACGFLLVTAMPGSGFAVTIVWSEA